MCLATMAYLYTACTVRVTIFITGDKFAWFQIFQKCKYCENFSILAGKFPRAKLGLLFAGWQFCNDIHNPSSESAQSRNKAPSVISKHRLEGFELTDGFIPLIMAGDRLST